MPLFQIADPDRKISTLYDMLDALDPTNRDAKGLPFTVSIESRFLHEFLFAAFTANTNLSALFLSRKCADTLGSFHTGSHRIRDRSEEGHSSHDQLPGFDWSQLCESGFNGLQRRRVAYMGRLASMELGRDHPCDRFPPNW